MKLEYFIARKITKGSKNSRLSKPIVRIALIGIILGMAVMILTICIVKGFQQEVRDRAVAFGSHIQITKFTNNNSLEPQPMNENQAFLKELESDERVEHIQQFATKNGIIKTKTENEGIVVKGVGKDHDWGFIGRHIVDGKTFDPKIKTEDRPILISKFLSERLGIKTGDKIFIYFLLQKKTMTIKDLKTDSVVKAISYYVQETEDSIRNLNPFNEAIVEEPDTQITIKYDQSIKDFIVSGIYETGLEEFDKKIIFSQLDIVKKINHWRQDQTGGFEVILRDGIVNENGLSKLGRLIMFTFSHNEFYKREPLDLMGDDIYNLVGEGITSQTVKDANPSIFMWLDMHDTTAWIVLILMVIVSVINMVSALIILIIEKTNMIGILKALGMDNQKVKKIFLIQAAKLIGKGMLWGNIFGLGIAFTQKYFHMVKLDQATYYISFVPIKFEWLYLILLNIGTFGICILFMLLPAIIISRTTPIKAIRFN